MSIKPKRPLTDRQFAILSWMEEFMEKNHMPPTLREIGAQFGIGSTNGVRSNVDKLVLKGFVKHIPTISRGYVPLRISKTERTTP